MNTISFPVYKYEGTGNDFIIIDEWERQMVPEEYKGLISKRLCERKGSIGADGVLFWSKSEIADGKMRVFNADGSEAEMCGNGMRCVTKYAFENGQITNTVINVETLKGSSNVTLIPSSDDLVDRIKVLIDAPMFNAKDIPMVGEPYSKLIDEDFFVDDSIRTLKLTALSVGNPHVVYFTEDISKVDVVSTGRVLENHAAFPNRTNVNFVEILSRRSFRIRTFERGVGLTLSCGSGISASTIAGVITERLDKDAEISVIADGGQLWSEAFDDGDGISVYLIGPANKLLSGKTTVEITNGEVVFQDGITIYDGVFYEGKG